MNFGRIEQIGSPSEVYHAPLTTFVANFVGDTNVFVRTDGTNGHFVSDGIVLRVPGLGRIAVVRPEAILVDASIEPTPGWNIIDGVVREIVFQGADVRYHVTVNNGREVIVETNRPSPDVTINQNIQIGWPIATMAMIDE